MLRPGKRGCRCFWWRCAQQLNQPRVAPMSDDPQCRSTGADADQGSGEPCPGARRGKRLVGIRRMPVQTQSESGLVRTAGRQCPTAQQPGTGQERRRHRFDRSSRPRHSELVEDGGPRAPEQHTGQASTVRIRARIRALIARTGTAVFESAGQRLRSRQQLGFDAPHPELAEKCMRTPLLRQQDGQPRTRSTSRDLPMGRQQSAQIVHLRRRQVGGEERELGHETSR